MLSGDERDAPRADERTVTPPKARRSTVAGGGATPDRRPVDDDKRWQAGDGAFEHPGWRNLISPQAAVIAAAVLVARQWLVSRRRVRERRRRRRSSQGEISVVEPATATTAAEVGAATDATAQHTNHSATSTASDNVDARSTSHTKLDLRPAQLVEAASRQGHAATATAATGEEGKRSLLPSGLFPWKSRKPDTAASKPRSDAMSPSRPPHVPAKPARERIAEGVAGTPPPTPPTPSSASYPLQSISPEHPLQGMTRSAQLLAAARALEMEHFRTDALFQDPFAERLAGAKVMAAQREKAKASTVDQLSRIPVRTRYFDDFLLRCLQGKEQGAASNEPLPRQVVLLGAGLDMRAYRLRVPREVAFYELDLPVVMEYKLKILRSEFADRKPYCVVKYVPSDLCKDWKRDLLAAGFNPRQSSVWLLEGLTYYLDEATCRRLFQDMRSLTPAGRASWMCASFVKEALVRKLRAQSSSSSSATSRGSGESSESARPIADAQRLSRQASENAAGAALRTSSSRKWPPFVFGTDDPERFLKPLGFYVTSVACLGDAEANYGRFAAPFRHTMYVTAFAG